MKTNSSSTSAQNSVYDFAPAVWLENHYPRRARHTVLAIVSVFLFILILLELGKASFSFNELGLLRELVISLDIGEFLLSYGPLIDALTALILAVWLETVALDAYWNWHSFRGYSDNFSDEKEGGGVTYEVAEAILDEEDSSNTPAIDLTKAFVRSAMGRLVLTRLGIGSDEREEFIDNKQRVISVHELDKPVRSGKVVTLAFLGELIFTSDDQLRDWLFRQGIDESEFFGCLGWVDRGITRKKRRRRFYSRDRLSLVPAFGRDFSYGRAYTLERFSRNLRLQGVYESVVNSQGDNEYAQQYVEELETALMKSRDANAILVGEPGAGAMDIVIEFSRSVSQGRTPPEFTGKHVYLLDTNRLVSEAGGKVDFERLLQRLLGEAAHAGNAIIVIENLPSFLQSVGAYGSDVLSLFDAFSGTGALQIIATADPSVYHETLERNPRFIRHFQRISIESPDTNNTIMLLEDIAEREEYRHGVILTYQAIAAVAKLAEQKITDGVMPQKAIDLLFAVTAHAGESGQTLVTENTVQAVVRQQTGIPTGVVSEEEQSVLANLEDILHERVVVQDEAIHAVAEALRRVRAGVESADRPIGSFLFLGPTGVGKTETAKALAEAYFDGEDKLRRLDMSEYSGEGALVRLIGSPDGSSGMLANLVREHPYGVLLIDEFEKASRATRDLFLQILDEGHFSDGSGSRVNLTNYLIIATSNAGAEMIMDRTSAGHDVSDSKEELIQAVIHNGSFRPELINRFDATVIYHPLSQDELLRVANLLLEKLSSRIHEQGYNLEIGPAVPEFLVEHGYNPKFGARAMRRVIQDTIESVIAHRILEGNMSQGSTIQVDRSDLENKVLTNT